MFEKFARNLFIFSIFSMVVMALYLGRKPICINSKLVDKIDVQSEDKTESIYRCGFNHHVPFSAFWNDNQIYLTREISKAEELFSWLGPVPFRFKILVDRVHPDNFAMKGADLTLGENMLLAKGQLQKALIKSWLAEKMDSATLQQDLFLESLSDLFYYGSNGGFSLYDPVSQMMVTDDDNLAWPRLIKTVGDYCLSPWRISEHTKLCSQINEAKSDLGSQLSVYSLRPILTSALIHSYKSLGPYERLDVLRLIVEHMQKSTWAEVSSDINADDFVVYVDKYLQSMEDFWALNQNSKRLVSWFEMAREDISQKMRIHFKRKLNYDFIISVAESEQITPDFLELLNQGLQKHPEQSVLLMQGQRKWNLPSKYPFNGNELSEYSGHVMVQVNCGMPSLKEVLAWSDITQRLISVDQCHDLDKIKFADLFSSGIEFFAEANPQISFVQFHLPSLKMSMGALGDSNNVFQLVDSQTSEGYVNKLFGWKKPFWDERAQAYKVQASIDAIEWYRAPKGKVIDLMPRRRE